MVFILLIFLHNFKIIISTRNRVFFSIKTQKQGRFLINKNKTKDITKLTVLSIKQHAKNTYFLGFFPQVDDYFKDIQSGSFSSLSVYLLKLFQWLKGLLETTKTILFAGIFSLKYRFFWLKNHALIMREKLIWLLEENFPSREATLGKAFVFADLSGAPETIYHSFKVIGILHLIAASSANIYLIISFLTPLLAVLEYFFGQKMQALAKLLVIISYFILINGHFNLVDSSPSILRASLSCILAILATQLFSVTVKRLNLLIVVAILCLIINPFYLQSLAFQLSFCASFIILFYWPYIKKKIAKSSLMFSFVMQFFLWPLLIGYFSNVNLIAIPANIVLSALVEFLTIIYFLFIVSKACHLVFLTNFSTNLIYLVNDIFFKLLSIFEKIAFKNIIINQDKILIISSLLSIQLLFILLICFDKKNIYTKNKYRILCKWSNYMKVR